MKLKKRHSLIAIACILMIISAIFIWKRYASATRIAFVNYQTITLGQISKANDNSFIIITELPVEQLDKASDFDMVMLNGMGLRITEEQRQELTKAAEEGTPVMTTAATNPQNQIVSVDSVDNEFLRQYLVGGRGNYRNMLRYIRRYIDGKKFKAPMPADPQVSASSLLYYPSENDDLNFPTVADYEAWMRRTGRWKEDAPRIILTGQMGVPDSLTAALERTGNMVYPVNSLQSLINGGHADTIGATAVVNMAHGRLGDRVRDYLTENDIILFSPLNVNRDYNEWLDDKMGMNGGFLSQSVVTPEIDGAVRPYALFAHFTGDDGLPSVQAIPDRLKSFTETVNNYIALRSRPNQEKHVAIFYFKGPGQNALVAEGMEVAPSLFNLLTRLKAEGYNVAGLPSTAAELQRMIDENGKVFNKYAAGTKADFVKTHSPEIITREDYDKWCTLSLSPGMRREIDALDGDFPGHGLSDENGNLALSRLRFGNIVLIPQPVAGLGDDDFKIVHGTDAAPPHNYTAAYLWARHGFNADAILHFGAHGSLEFTPRKQVALGSTDWPDRLVATMPHFYVWSTSNVGEAMLAKRRAYASIISYLTPPFMESGVRGIYKNLTDAISDYNRTAGADNTDEAALRRAAALVKKYTVELGIHRELRLDNLLSQPYSPDEIARIESFADELANEKITGALYVMGRPYAPEHIRTTVTAMTADPIAYSLHRLSGRQLPLCRQQAMTVVSDLLASQNKIDDTYICRLTGITQTELDSARTVTGQITGSKDMLSRMMVMGSINGSAMKRKPADAPQPAHPEATMSGSMPDLVTGEFSKEAIEFAMAVTEVERTVKNVDRYRQAFIESPQAEIDAVVHALAGGFVTPASGGDPVLNPDILPTGRNMYAINAEETPSQVAWEKGKSLAENTIKMYRKAHNDSIPRKVSYTLWSSEFIETEGATIAQVLYMLGVEPVRDPFGRVTDLRLIPSAELGRPRIDVVVQTSGQLRDLAASRLFLISRAVRMAAQADDKDFVNYVTDGVVEAERILVGKGVPPKEARELSTARVFGGVNGNYGTGIQSMVEAGDRWDNESEIAATYINNMGATYGSEDDWERVHDHALEAALSNTDVVVQPRQSNTWGALSLDHVYEFMGGMNLAVRNVTGKDPDAYLSDYRNRNNVRMQELKEAVGVESRTTILNPNYIKEKMKGGAGDASALADVVRNTYGWNVMKPDVIDNELWNDIYDNYVADRNNLGIKDYFAETNPAALQEMTAVMLETVRKGMWDASPEQIAEMARLHIEMIDKYGAGCSGFVCDNALLREYIAGKVSTEAATGYKSRIADVRAENISDADGMVMKREEMNQTAITTNHINGFVMAIIAMIVLMIFAIIIRRHKNHS